MSHIARRRRRSSRIADSQPPPCHFANLPLELLERIVDGLSCDDLYSLAATSKLFSRTFRLRAVLGQLKDVAMGENTSWEGELFCLSDAIPGRFGWSPFLMFLDEEALGYDEDGDLILLVSAVTPTFERFELDTPTKDYLYVTQTSHEVWLRCEYFDGGYARDIYNEDCYSWDHQLAGKLLRATPELLNARFECPECNGGGEVMAGSREVAKRWPRLVLSEYGPIGVPCPRCEVTYDYAVEVYHDVQAELHAQMEAEFEAEMERDFMAAYERGEYPDLF